MTEFIVVFGALGAVVGGVWVVASFAVGMAEDADQRRRDTDAACRRPF